MKKIRVGILGATGMVGQRFVTLLAKHPWFEINVLAASPQSAGQTYEKAVQSRWLMDQFLPDSLKKIEIKAVIDDFSKISKEVDMVFSALDLDKEIICEIEEKYASAGVTVISNNSAHRWTEDVPMIIPEVNPDHLELINKQRKNRHWTTGLIAVKPNCSIQSYTIILTALKKFKPLKIMVSSLQAISGAGKTFTFWPEMIDNVIPFINGEEEKSEREPLKIWGELKNNKIKLAQKPLISATCLRVPISNGHLASVSVKFKNKPQKNEIIQAINNFNPLKKINLPSSPKILIKYFEDDNRPQTKLDRDFENGMGVTMGRLRNDPLFDWKFVALSHNTVRGAAGGAILLAELLYKKGYLKIS